MLVGSAGFHPFGDVPSGGLLDGAGSGRREPRGVAGAVAGGGTRSARRGGAPGRRCASGPSRRAGDGIRTRSRQRACCPGVAGAGSRCATRQRCRIQRSCTPFQRRLNPCPRTGEGSSVPLVANSRSSKPMTVTDIGTPTLSTGAAALAVAHRGRPRRGRRRGATRAGWCLAGGGTPAGGAARDCCRSWFPPVMVDRTSRSPPPLRCYAFSPRPIRPSANCCCRISCWPRRSGDSRARPGTADLRRHPRRCATG